MLRFKSNGCRRNALPLVLGVWIVSAGLRFQQRRHSSRQLVGNNTINQPVAGGRDIVPNSSNHRLGESRPIVSHTTTAHSTYGLLVGLRSPGRMCEGAALLPATGSGLCMSGARLGW